MPIYGKFCGGFFDFVWVGKCNDPCKSSPRKFAFFFPLQKVWKMNFQPKNLPYAEGMKDHSPVVCRVKFSHYLHSDKLTKLAGMAGPGLSRCISY